MTPLPTNYLTAPRQKVVPERLQALKGFVALHRQRMAGQRAVGPSVAVHDRREAVRGGLLPVARMWYEQRGKGTRKSSAVKRSQVEKRVD